MAKLRSKQAAGGLLEKIKASDPKTWLDKLSAEHRKEVMELRRAWQAGEVAAGPMRVHQDLTEYLGREVVSETQLRRFLGKKPKESA